MLCYHPTDMDSEESNEEEALKLVQSLQVFEICGPAMDSSLYPQVCIGYLLQCGTIISEMLDFHSS